MFGTPRARPFELLPCAVYVDLPGVNLMPVILSHPQVGGQSENCQTERRGDDLLYSRYGKRVSRVTVDNCYLHGLKANHDQPGESRREHTHFASCKDRCCGKERTSTHTDH